MNKVDIIRGFSNGSYTMYLIKPEGFVNYGGSRDTLAFDYINLADNWLINKEILDKIASYDLKFKQAMSVHVKENKDGSQEKTLLISADVVPDLLVKLRDSGQAEVLDFGRELQVIKKMIHIVVGQ